VAIELIVRVRLSGASYYGERRMRGRMKSKVSLEEVSRAETGRGIRRSREGMLKRETRYDSVLVDEHAILI